MFADDSVLIQSHLNSDLAIANLENDLKEVTNYFAGLKLSLNKSKTKILNVDLKVKHSSMKPFPSLKLGDVVIKAVEVFSYLGVKIDRYINMKVHLNNCVKRAHGKLYMLGKVRRFMDRNTALNLF